MLASTQLQNLLLLLCFMQIQRTLKSPACQWRWTTQTDNNANDCGISTLTKLESECLDTMYQGAKFMVYIPRCVCVGPCAISKQCKLLHVMYPVLGLIATYNIMTTIWYMVLTQHPFCYAIICSGTLPPTHINAPFEAGVIAQQQTCTLPCKAFRYTLFTPSHTH